jgi:hypothetical protein
MANWGSHKEEHLIDEFGGIYPPYEAFYILSIIYAAERSIDAFRRFEAAAATEIQAHSIVSSVQEALQHAAALSRFFWPPKSAGPIGAARAKKLRQAFELDDTSALKDRRLRNSFEHFDERLDAFLLEDHVGYFFPQPMVDDDTLSNEAVAHIFKLADPKKNTCVVLGEKFEFQSIRNEALKILTDAQEMDHAGSRLRPSAERTT